MKIAILLLFVYIYLSEPHTYFGGAKTSASHIQTSVEPFSETGYVMSNRRRRGVVEQGVLMSMRALRFLTRKARPYTRDQGVQYFVKNGDLTTAMKDFKSINPTDVRKYATDVEVGRIGNRLVFIRKEEDRPTISISEANGKKVAISVVYNKDLYIPM